jgi:hypothetical protein
VLVDTSKGDGIRTLVASRIPELREAQEEARAA